MKKSWNFFLILVIIFQLWGCGSHFSQPGIQNATVTSIEIRCESCETLTRHYYSDPRKLRLILLCIRRLGPDFPTAEDVSALSGKLLLIRLQCADGSAVTYRLKNNQYLQKNDGNWRKLNADSAAGLYQLILQLPSDPSPQGLRTLAPTLAEKKKEKNHIFSKKDLTFCLL